jgi:hypothetical protein
LKGVLESSGDMEKRINGISAYDTPLRLMMPAIGRHQSGA